MPVCEDTFGTATDAFTKQSETVRRFTLSNKNGYSAQVITYGSTITSIKMPDKNKVTSDIVLGFDDVSGFVEYQRHYFGSTIGRVCNRVGNGTFTLNGKQICVTKNMKDKHQLHGGFAAFDQMHWQVPCVGEDSVTMKLVSPDGHEGYPGEVTVTATYTMTESNCFRVQLEAVTTQTTAVNMTNHAYFNLAGHDAGKCALYDHSIMIRGSCIAETDSDQIPTGELTSVGGGLWDFRNMTNLGERVQKLPVYGYDNNYCLDLDRNQTVTVVAKACHPKSGRWMEVATNQPGLQFYTSNNLPDPEKNEEPVIGKSGGQYWKHGAYCMETQKYPDAVNHKNFPSIILKPNETYRHEFIYKLGVNK